MIEKNIDKIENKYNQESNKKNIDDKFSSEVLLQLFIKDSLERKNKDK